jgi:hypothetical protein
MRVANWAVAAVAAMVTLLAPALWNGFPLLEYDTGGYLARWFEGYLVPSRSTVYGLFVVAGWPLDFWPQVVLQAAATVWVLALVLRSYGFGGRPWTLLAVVVALCATTTLPWIAGILLTDIFAGLAVLALHLVVMRADTLGRGERLALVFFVAFCGASHSATFLILLGLAAVALLVALIARRIVVLAGALRAAAAVALAAVMLVSANFALSGEIAWTPGGYGIVFARMMQDGIVTRYLDAHCAEESFKLCPYRHSFPATADQFLWRSGSIFDKLGRFEGLDQEMRRIVLGSLIEYPGAQLEAATAAAGRQLISVGTGEGVLTPLMHTEGIIRRYMPSVVPAMQAARQQHDELRFAAINAVHVPVALATMALLPLLFVLGLRVREYRDVGLLAATVSLAILANAVVCGTLSNPHDRYGARLAWVPLLVAALALLSRQSVAAKAADESDAIASGARA